MVFYWANISAKDWNKTAIYPPLSLALALSCQLLFLSFSMVLSPCYCSPFHSTAFLPRYSLLLYYPVLLSSPPYRRVSPPPPSLTMYAQSWTLNGSLRFLVTTSPLPFSCFCNVFSIASHLSSLCVLLPVVFFRAFSSLHSWWSCRLHLLYKFLHLLDSKVTYKGSKFLCIILVVSLMC